MSDASSTLCLLVFLPDWGAEALPLEDAAYLAHRWAGHADPGELFAAFERDRRARCALVVRMSLMMGRMGQLERWPARKARDRGGTHADASGRLRSPALSISLKGRLGSCSSGASGFKKAACASVLVTL